MANFNTNEWYSPLSSSSEEDFEDVQIESTQIMPYQFEPSDTEDTNSSLHVASIASIDTSIDRIGNTEW